MSPPHGAVRNYFNGSNNSARRYSQWQLLSARGSLHIYFFYALAKSTATPEDQHTDGRTTQPALIPSHHAAIVFRFVARINFSNTHRFQSSLSAHKQQWTKRIFLSGCGLRRDHLHETRPQTPNELYSSLCTTFCGCGQRESEINPNSRECNWRWPKIELWIFVILAAEEFGTRTFRLRSQLINNFDTIANWGLSEHSDSAFLGPGLTILVHCPLANVFGQQKIGQWPFWSQMSNRLSLVDNFC